ncbi:MAG: glycosyltransferase family 2 protein [Pseudomonadota bacterium]
MASTALPENCDRTVEVIVVNWNGRRLLADCLEGLNKQQYGPFSVTLVDNGSEDGSVRFVAQNYPEIQIIALPENKGFCAANNMALKKTRADYVALLNNDAIPDPQWIKNLVYALERHPQAGFAASKMVFYDAPGTVDRAGDAYTRAGTGLLRGRGEPEKLYDQKEWVFGACAGAALYRRKMLEDIGLFDEDFFLLYEDVDLSFRAQLKGYRCLYVPNARVYHRSSSSIVHDSALSVYYSHRNLEWVYIKNMPRPLILKTLLPHLVYNLAAMVFFLIKGKGGVYLKAKIDALKKIKAMLNKRGKIQSQKSALYPYIWHLMEKESFINRLKRRH